MEDPTFIKLILIILILIYYFRNKMPGLLGSIWDIIKNNKQ